MTVCELQPKVEALAVLFLVSSSHFANSISLYSWEMRDFFFFVSGPCKQIWSQKEFKWSTDLGSSSDKTKCFIDVAIAETVDRRYVFVVDKCKVCPWLNQASVICRRCCSLHEDVLPPSIGHVFIGYRFVLLLICSHNYQKLDRGSCNRWESWRYGQYFAGSS